MYKPGEEQKRGQSERRACFRAASSDRLGRGGDPPEGLGRTELPRRVTRRAGPGLQRARLGGSGAGPRA